MLKRQPIIATAAVCFIYLAYVVVAGAIAHLQLASAATDSFNAVVRGILFVVGFVLWFAVPLIIVTGLLTAVVLYRYGVRGPAAYLGNAVISAALAAYVFLFNFAIAENLGAILEYVPKNGKDDSDGMISRAPQFLETMGSAFRGLYSLVHEEWRTFEGFAIAALVVAVLCGGLFWMIRVRQPDEKTIS
jgi:hypothetical protein